MLYYTSIVHLFRPMLKVDLIHSHVRPRDACIDASNQVADLLRLYRAHYSLRACHLVLTHILLSVNIVHLLYSNESEESYRNMVEGLKALEDISTCHYFGKRGFKIIHALSKVWNLPFPEELGNRIVTSKAGSSQGLLSPQSDSFFIGSHTSAIDSRMGGGVGFGSMSSAVPPSQRESLNMFAHPDPKTTQMPPNPTILSSSASSSVSSQTKPNQLHHRAPQQQQPQQRIVSTYPPASSSALQTQPPAPPSTAPASMAADTLFWGPPGIGMPIVPRNYQMSPMDLDSMLGNANEWDRLSRDGFKMSDQWQQDPMTPFGGGGAGGPDPGHHPHPHHAEDYGQHHHHHQQQQQHHHHGGPAGAGEAPHEFHPGQDSVPFAAQELGQQGGQGHAHHQHQQHHAQQHHGFDAAGWWGEEGPAGPLS